MGHYGGNEHIYNYFEYKNFLISNGLKIEKIEITIFSKDLRRRIIFELSKKLKAFENKFIISDAKVPITIFKIILGWSLAKTKLFRKIGIINGILPCTFYSRKISKKH